MRLSDQTARSVELLDSEQFYRLLRFLGVRTGPSARGLEDLRRVEWLERQAELLGKSEADVLRCLAGVLCEGGAPSAKTSPEVMPTPARGARVFVSHSSADKPFVRRLVDDLKRAGLRVWLDELELKVGDSIVGGVQGGLGEADYVVAVLSPSAVRSNWVQAELASALMNQISERGTVVLPVVIQDCEIPPLLEDRLYADFRGDYETGLRRLLAALDVEQVTVEAAQGGRSLQGAVSPQDPAEACRARLSTLSLGDLRRLLLSSRSRCEVADLWYDLFESQMDDEVGQRLLNECIRELIDRARRNRRLADLIRELCKNHPRIGAEL